MSSSSPAFDGDDWTKTKNAKERKKIQDRLAQRARRKRKKEIQAAQHAPIATDEAITSSTNAGASSATCSEMQQTVLATDGSDTQDLETGAIDFRSRVSQASLNIDPDAFFLVLRCQTVISALGANAASIPVYCQILTPTVLNETNIRSPPPPLMPTPLQAEIPHLAFVAALPFAGLRDSILRALPYVNYNDLWEDAVGGGFFILGSQPWAPQGWEVTEQFAIKWWFLLDREVVEMANFWRQQRGLPRLPRLGPPQGS